jgi:rhodanese-related sulfurtransferase
MVRTAINIPAQSFYPTRLTWVELFGKIPFVIFYCSSSNGRGPRCAGWFQDALDENGDQIAKSFVLAGGIKGWVEAHLDLVDPVLHFQA